MKRNRTPMLFGIAVVLLALLACDVGDFTAMLSSATPTRTRTPRPTFTPRPSVTATPEDTATPEPSPTAVIVSTSTATRRPVAAATPRPATPKPVAPPPPSFPVSLNDSYLCPQEGGAYYKITGRVNKPASSVFVGGYVLGVFSSSGQFMKASQPSSEDEYATITIGGNCRAESWFRSNVEIDVTEFRMQLPLIIRVIRSASDRTAISPDFKATFEQPGNYYLQYNVSQ